MENFDVNGVPIKVGDTVNVPYPTSEDQWNFEFQGSVSHIMDDYAIVTDGVGDCWCVEFERLEVETHD